MRKTVLFCLFLSAFFTSMFVSAGRVSCKSFKTQAEAQLYFIKHKAMNLDRDGDGQACDCLLGGNGTKCPKKK